MSWSSVAITAAVLASILGVCCGKIIELDIGTLSEHGEIETMLYDTIHRNCDSIPRRRGEHCKYYGECCGDVVRIRERLKPGTYRCMNIGDTQGYVVSKCPSGTSKELMELCHRNQSDTHLSDELKLRDWPVTGSYTGVTYSNIYCAICNGALHPIVEGAELIFDPLAAVEFWTANIFCANQTVEVIENEEVEFNVNRLHNLLDSGECWLEHMATETGIHSFDCGNSISVCPDNYINGEIRTLCENGPFNPLTLNEWTYKNEFCQLCWKNLKKPAVLRLNIRPPNGILVAAVKPLVQSQREDSLSDENFRSPDSPPEVLLSLRNNASRSYEFVKISSNVEAVDVWHLGSMHCVSNFNRVCGEFIVFPSKDEGGDCSGPGCGYNQVQDLGNSCTNLGEYQYNQNITLKKKFHWAFTEISKYFSTCRAPYQYRRNCECDSRCVYFNNCCFDATIQTARPKHLLKSTCHELYSNSFPTGMVVVNSCPSGTSTEDVNLCESGEIGEWSTYGWFVTDTDTLITYKNIYCARCNEAVNLTHWDASVSCSSDDLGNIIGLCTLLSYAPPTHTTNFFYTCALNEEYIDTCPDIYINWRLKADCESGNVSYVYYLNKVYKNYFCAICNLGDDMQYVDVVQDQPSRLLHSGVFMQPAGGKNVIKISYSAWACCGSCLFDTTERCLSIDNSTSLITRISSPVPIVLGGEISIDNLCGHSVLVCSQPTTIPPPIFITGIYERTTLYYGDSHRVGTDGRDGAPGGAHGDPGSPGGPGSVIRDVLRAPSRDFIAEEKAVEIKIWRKSNDSIMFCSNMTITSNLSNQAYGKIMLSKTGLQVLDVVNTTVSCTRSAPTRGHAPQDYGLIGFSLVAIICNVLFIAIKKRKPLSLPDMMMISLLLSLFGALICFALVTVPIGRDLIGCQALAAIMQFCFLSSLMWSNSIAISVVRSVYTMRLVSKSYKPFIMYSIYSFGVPLICVLITVILSKSKLAISQTIYRTEGICFLGENITMYSLFLVPIYILIVTNIIIGVLVMVKIVKTSSISSKKDTDRLKKNVITCFKVSICLGIGWVILFIATLHDDAVVWQVMQVFVELQGVLIACANAISWSCVHSVKKWTKSLTTSTESKSRTTSSAVSSSAPVRADNEVELN